ncbi:MAG TPA: amidohydrolase [Rhizobiaceae bacterium]|nr:amidohydrolase [Rhizobiaceae bacterium]
MILDTHLHIIDRKALSYPWLENVPPLNDDFSYERYAREAKRCGITDVMHMEVDVAEADMAREIDYVKGKAAEPDSLLRGKIAACRPESDSFAAWLDKVSADPFVKGLRRILHTQPDDLSESAVFRDNIRRMNGGRLSFDFCIFPRQNERARVLVDSAPDMQFILDHCGNPDIANNGFDAWKGGIEEMARRPNVAAKISGIVVNANHETWSVETLRPYVEHVIASFGWDRVIWGSDWPVSTMSGGLTSWVAATQAIVAGASADERNALFCGNARRIWGF